MAHLVLEPLTALDHDHKACPGISTPLRVAHGVALFLAASSFLASTYSVWTFWKYWNRLKSSLMHAVLYMQLSDSIMAVAVTMRFLPVALSSSGQRICDLRPSWRPDSVCVALGMVSQFAGLASISWYFVITVQTFLILVGTSPYTLSSNRVVVFRHVWVWSIVAAGTIVPLVRNAYGATDSFMSCWIMDDLTSRLLFYGPLAFYMFVALAVLVYFVKRYYCQPTTPQARIRSERVLRRLALFVLAFVVLWSPPVLNRVVLEFREQCYSEVPMFLQILHVIAIASVGLVNALVWMTSPIFAQLRDMDRLVSMHGSDGYVQHHDPNPPTSYGSTGDRRGSAAGPGARDAQFPRTFVAGLSESDSSDYGSDI